MEQSDATAKHNARMQEELDKIKAYRKSIEEEYASIQGKQVADNVKAKAIFADSISEVAHSLVNIATGRHPDASPGTVVKAAMYIYDRVIITDDDPRRDEMDKLLERLSTDPTPTPPNSTQ